MIQKLRWKFVLINMLLVTAVMVVVTGFFITSTRDSLAEDSISVLQRVISQEEGSSWSQAGEQGSVSLPYFIVVIQPDGGAAITDSQFYSLDDPDYLLSAINAALDQGYEQGLLKEYNLRYLLTASAQGWKLAFVDISYERSSLNKACVNAAVVGVCALVVFLGHSVLLARWAIGPVEKAWRQQRQFVADASHELKTPLTVILSNTELLERSCRDLPERDQRWLHNIRSGGEQMQWLVEELLLLARSDNEDGQKTPFQEVDLSDLTQSAALMFEAVAFEAGLRLESEEIEPELLMEGDPAKLNQLLDILLENAVKYSQTGGVIRLSLAGQGKKIRLEVSNDGVPIPEEELERIFDRFYRGDSARTSEGSGLGLSIARAIVHEHKGRLWAESDPTGVNTFLCMLPASGR